MSKKVITAEQVAQVPRGGTLDLPPSALVTPLARDVAAERSVTLRPAADSRGPGVEPGGNSVESRVREIVSRVLAASATTPGAVPAPVRPAVRLARGSDAVLEPFAFPGPGPGQQVHALDVVTAANGSPMAAGYMTLTKGSFPWALNYDEIQIVLEGELHLGGDAGGVVGRPGDILHVPKGSTITFGTPSWAKFVYVTFPADWAEQG